MSNYRQLVLFLLGCLALAVVATCSGSSGGGGGGGGGDTTTTPTLPAMFTIGNVSVNARDCTALFTVDKTAAWVAGTSITMATADGTGLAGTDYVASSKTGVIDAASFPFDEEVSLIHNPSGADGRTFKLTIASTASSTATGTATLSSTDASFTETFLDSTTCSRRWSTRTSTRAIASGKLLMRIKGFNDTSLPVDTDYQLIQNEIHFGPAPYVSNSVDMTDVAAVNNSQIFMGQISVIQADAALTSAEVTPGFINTQMRVAGAWYHSGANGAGCTAPNCIDRTNDVFGAIAVRSQDVVAYVTTCDDLDCGTSTLNKSQVLIDSTTTPAYVLGTEYRIKIAYDANLGTLSFSAVPLASGSPVGSPVTAVFTQAADGVPALTSPFPVGDNKHLTLGFMKAKLGEGGDAQGTFDNVMYDIGGGLFLYDNFDSASVLDPSKWSSANLANGSVASIATAELDTTGGGLHLKTSGQFLNGKGFNYFTNGLSLASVNGVPAPLLKRKVSATLVINSLSVAGATVAPKPNARAGMEIRYKAGAPFTEQASSQDVCYARLSAVKDTTAALVMQLGLVCSNSANFVVTYGGAPATVTDSTNWTIGIGGTPTVMTLEETAPGTWTGTYNGTSHTVSVPAGTNIYSTTMVPANFFTIRLAAQPGAILNTVADSASIDATFANISIGK